MSDATETTITGPARTHPGREADLEHMITTLALAFDDDPIVSWVVRDDDRRPQAIRRVFTLELGAALPHGEVYRAGDTEGVAVWYPPGDTWQLSPADQEYLAQEFPEISGERRRERPFALVEATNRAHPRQPHRYLHWLGVVPSSQGGGVGSALLREMLTRCDADGLPAYLEATSRRNVRLYERHGFAVTEQLRIPGGCPPLWLMWREPSPAG